MYEIDCGRAKPGVPLDERISDTPCGRTVCTVLGTVIQSRDYLNIETLDYAWFGGPIVPPQNELNQLTNGYRYTHGSVFIR